MSKKYTDKDLVDILAEVEVEFKKHLKPEAEGEKIAKSEKEPSQENTSNAESFDYDEEDMAEMEKMYKSMNKTEAEAHYKTLKKAMFGEQAEEITKSETVKVEDVKVVEENKLLKSEIETVKAENEELKKSFGKVTEMLTKMFGKKEGAPKQKAITNIEVIKKSEEEVKKEEEKDFSKISKSEVSAKLTAAVRSGKLQKNDKDAINQYYVDYKIDSVKHLL